MGAETSQQVEGLLHMGSKRYLPQKPCEAKSWPGIGRPRLQDTLDHDNGQESAILEIHLQC